MMSSYSANRDKHFWFAKDTATQVYVPETTA